MNSPLIFLPGWGLGRGPLKSIADAQGGQIFDLPGYGTAPLIEHFFAAADDIAARLPPAATLAGWSLGAQLALAVAARAPAKVGKLVLVAGTVSFVQRDGWRHAMPPAMLADFASGMAADANAMLPRFVGGFNRGDARAKAVTQELLRLTDPLPGGLILATGLNWLRDIDLRPLAPQIQAPTLLIHGTADPLMPLAAAQTLATLIPDAQLTTFDDCAHAPFISQPEAFNTRLAAFLNA